MSNNQQEDLVAWHIANQNAAMAQRFAAQVAEQDQAEKQRPM
jgi:hypothetical protein